MPRKTVMKVKHNFPLVGVFTDQCPGVLWYGETTNQREKPL
jgi:hypothetical protein